MPSCTVSRRAVSSGKRCDAPRATKYIVSAASSKPLAVSIASTVPSVTQAHDQDVHTWWGLLAMYYFMTITPSELVSDAVRACIPGCPSRATIKDKLMKEVNRVLSDGFVLEQRCDGHRGLARSGQVAAGRMFNPASRS